MCKFSTASLQTSPCFETPKWLRVGVSGFYLPEVYLIIFGSSSPEVCTLKNRGKYLGEEYWGGRNIVILMAQLVNPPTVQQTWVQSLSWEDPQEKRTVTHSNILAWRILYCPWCCKELDTTERLSLYCDTLIIAFLRWTIFYLCVLLAAWHGAWNTVLSSKC